MARCVATVVSALVTITFVASASAGAPRRHRGSAPGHRMLSSLTSKLTRTPRLVFGIYPGGGAGTVGPSGPTKPEDPVRRLTALEQLRPPGRPFIARLYASYTGPGGWSADQQIGGEIDEYGRAGFQIEVVLCYRPADGGVPPACRDAVCATARYSFQQACRSRTHWPRFFPAHQCSTVCW